MSNVEEPAKTAPDPDDAWAESLREVFVEVIRNLPDHATLGELIEATKNNAQTARVLEVFTVQELIDLAKARPRPRAGGNGEAPAEVEYDEDGNPVMSLDGSAPAVIRRRADAPDGDVRVLRTLAENGPAREQDLASVTQLTSEQTRLIVRHLRTKGMVHVEGSATKRRLKITRHGSSHLRKLRRRSGN
jgi:hypothetical protein